MVSFLSLCTLSMTTVSGPRPRWANLYAIAAPWAPPPQITTLAWSGKVNVGKGSSLALRKPTRSASVAAVEIVGRFKSGPKPTVESTDDEIDDDENKDTLLRATNSSKRLYKWMEGWRDDLLTRWISKARLTGGWIGRGMEWTASRGQEMAHPSRSTAPPSAPKWAAHSDHNLGTAIIYEKIRDEITSGISTEVSNYSYRWRLL